MLNKLEVRILAELGRSSEGLRGFSLFRRIRVPLSEFSDAMSSLKDSGLIEEGEKDCYEITSQGVERAATLSPFLDGSPKPWRKVPERFIERRIKIQEMYVPSISKLDQEMLNDK